MSQRKPPATRASSSGPFLRELGRRLAAVEEKVKAFNYAQLGQSSMEGGGLDLYDDEGNYRTTIGHKPNGTYGVGYNIDSTVIREGGIETPSLAANSITGDKINAQSVAAAVGDFIQVVADNILAGTIKVVLRIVTGGEIVAGDPNGPHASMMEDGFRTYSVSPGEDGQMYVATRLGNSDGSDSLEIMQNPDDPPVASISTEGDITGATLSSNGDVYVQGTPLVGRLLDPDSDSGMVDILSWGCRVTGADFKAFVDGITINPGGSVTPIGQFQVELRPNRVYQITMPWRGYVSAESGNDSVHETVNLYCSNATQPGVEAPDPTTSDAYIGSQGQRWTNAGTGVSDCLTATLATGDPAGGAPVNYKFLLGLWANYGTFMPDADPSRLTMWKMTVIDTGAVSWPVQVTAPGADVIQTYETTWEASNSRVWRGDGQQSNDGSQKVRQGVGAGGQYHSAIVFNSTSISGQPVSVPTALDGAVVLKAEVFLHSIYMEQDTGEVELRAWRGGALPATLKPPGIISDIVKQTYTSRSQGRWIEIPTSWITPNQTGVWLAEPDWLFPASHTAFVGATGTPKANRPKLRMTYRK